MLITTHSGIVVNTTYIAFIALRQHTPEANITAGASETPRHKVLLFLAGGEPIVAADRLSRATAEFLRKDITHHWAEGSALFDVTTSLGQHRDGAYYTRNATEETEGGD